MRKYVYMSEENITQKFRLKKLFNWKISQNELISKKHKKLIGLWIISNTYLF